MADEADLADGYAERIVEESLQLLKNRVIERGADCTFCEENPCETLPNGVMSMLCIRCRLEREEELKKTILPVSICPEQGDCPEDSWTETMIPSNRYKRRWFLYIKPANGVLK